MTLGEKIKKLRLSKNLTQADLADQIHVTFQTVSKWENNENEPDVSTLRELSKLFECSLDYLLSPDEEENKNEPAAVVVAPVTQNVIKENAEVVHEKGEHQCEICHKEIPEEELYVREIHTSTHHHGCGTSRHTRTAYYHKTCYAEKTARDAERAKAEKERTISKAKKISFGLSIPIGVVALVIGILIFIKGAEMAVFPSILLGILVGYAIFSAAYCILTGSYLAEVFIWCTSLSIKFPGLIFSWDLDGIVWVICMKALFAVLGFLVGLLTLVFGIALSGALGMVSFPFVLIHNNRNGYDDSFFVD